MLPPRFNAGSVFETDAASLYLPNIQLAANTGVEPVQVLPCLCFPSRPITVLATRHIDNEF